MALVAIAWPNSEPERAAMVSLLEANEVPYFVHGANFAALIPGLQIAGYNAPTIMVPEHAAQTAAELLTVFANPPGSSGAAPLPIGFWAKVRVILEAVLFGWPVARPPVLKDRGNEP